jgi:beta-fructofuranosidase
MSALVFAQEEAKGISFHATGEVKMHLVKYEL